MVDTLPNIGIITGNFDIIHPGYVKLFKELQDSCNNPFILLHGDPTIERPEKLKPILSVDERIEIIESYFWEPFFLIYNTEAELLTLLKSLRPDIRLMGDDYYNKRFTGDDLGIPVKWIDRSHGWSTTKYKQAIADTL
ncbi:adenylyltransferase/cytidyltransferase family protein [bacterium]|nr:adenylyltransferase/cytidyltransferase family protein [bacterium]